MLEQQITAALKEAMKSKNEAALRALRAIKSAILLAKTEAGASDSLTEEQEQKMLSRLSKQRRESIEIYEKQGREDLALTEREELAVIENYLPKQLSDEEITAVLQQIISENNLSGAAQVGKLMPLAMKALGGKADGKKINEIGRNLLAG